jgi:hypothetical protein
MHGMHARGNGVPRVRTSDKERVALVALYRLWLGVGGVAGERDGMSGDGGSALEEGVGHKHVGPKRPAEVLHHLQQRGARAAFSHRQHQAV